MNKNKLNILVLCTGNSCRSQMAEGFLRKHGGNSVTVKSAGLLAAGVHPRAIEVMAEIGIDISGHTSNNMNEYLNEGFDYVITVCDHAAAHCPVFPTRTELNQGTRPERRRGKKTQRVHWPIDDPVGTKGTEEEIMTAFRKTRDLIGATVKEWVGEKH